MKEYSRFVIYDPLTEDYLISFIHEVMWSDSFYDIHDEALFSDLVKAKRVVKLVVDRYKALSDDDKLILEIHTITVNSIYTDPEAEHDDRSSFNY